MPKRPPETIVEQVGAGIFSAPFLMEKKVSNETLESLKKMFDEAQEDHENDLLEGRESPLGPVEEEEPYGPDLSFDAQQVLMMPPEVLVDYLVRGKLAHLVRVVPCSIAGCDTYALGVTTQSKPGLEDFAPFLLGITGQMFPMLQGPSGTMTVKAKKTENGIDAVNVTDVKRSVN